VGVSLMWASRSSPKVTPAVVLAHADLRAIFIQGFLTNVLNPKVWNLLVAWSAARFSSGFDRTRLAVWLNRCIGGVFVYLGIRIAFAKQA
jgi:threonine/homoserine/homoserine lactone efflux protein